MPDICLNRSDIRQCFGLNLSEPDDLAYIRGLNLAGRYQGFQQGEATEFVRIYVSFINQLHYKSLHYLML